jgi:oxepin-CoA hydrolase/3-oxo-5,6-dehydrosuberyl-CoA semialdehyde dehydrogenase
MSYTQNYALGAWHNPTGDLVVQHHAITGKPIAEAGDFDDYAAMGEYAARTGGAALRKMTFFERGLMLKQLALFLTERKERYYEVSAWTGATRGDSWIDIDGGIGNLFAYASLRRRMGNETFYVEGDLAKLSKNGTFIGVHVCVPKTGVAVHINAFNFPVWGMLEKCAVNWLAGMPAIVKASEVTSFLTEVVVRDIVGSGILPEGALQFIGGGGRGILDFVSTQDVVTFTGSAKTGKMLRALPHINANSVTFNLEADSLNAMILGEDIRPEDPEFEIFIKNVRSEIVVKAGQKCTAVRRIIVPAALLETVKNALAKEMAKTTIGNPAVEGVRMGALVSREQVERVRSSVNTLLQGSSIAFGSLDDFDVVGADRAAGFFFSPLLLLNERPFEFRETHEVEAFGPVSSIMPYQDMDDAITLANLGRGSLVSTLCTWNGDVARRYLLQAGAFHGRILFLNRESAKESTGHGSPMPMLTHGGPGRAGGGEEMGGIRGVMHYMQRIAVQGHPTMLSQVTRIWQSGAARPESDIHPFRRHFEDLTIGDTLVTAKHTVTEADIVNFANLTGDHFYAHVDETSLEGSPFEKRVAHGYYLLSKAAGLFVEAKKGPVLLNYGLDECRFVKPVYVGTTIGVRLTLKEKIDTETRNPEDIPKGIAKWNVEVYDQTDETVALATILTMVRKKKT